MANRKITSLVDENNNILGIIYPWDGMYVAVDKRSSLRFKSYEQAHSFLLAVIQTDRFLTNDDKIIPEEIRNEVFKTKRYDSNF